MSDKDLLQERARIVEDLITRAWSDESFKALLVADPAKAVAMAYGLKLPQSVTVKVLEETENTRYVVIPYRPPTTGELSGADLAAVAGGASAGRIGSTTLFRTTTLSSTQLQQTTLGSTATTLQGAQAMTVC